MVDVEQLARGVIRQALVDAGVGTEGGKRLSVNDANRNAARSFLTASTGSWRASREFWASAAIIPRRSNSLITKCSPAAPVKVVALTITHPLTPSESRLTGTR